MTYFKDKRILITGASRGLGAKAAKMFAKLGAIVGINYCDDEKNGIKVLKEIENIGGNGMLLQADVGEEKGVGNMLKKFSGDFGEIHCIVNNAGIVFDMELQERKIQHRDRTMKTNLFGIYNVCKQAYQYLSKDGTGRIINISSTNAHYYFSPGSIDYDASKAGILSLSKNFSKAYSKDGILVNSISPGRMDTAMNEGLSKELLDEELDRIYLKRMGDTEEIANVIVFLASDKASYINGTDIIVDGGYL